MNEWRWDNAIYCNVCHKLTQGIIHSYDDGMPGGSGAEGEICLECIGMLFNDYLKNKE